jgi:hypothetical protein
MVSVMLRMRSMKPRPMSRRGANASITRAAMPIAASWRP